VNDAPYLQSFGNLFAIAAATRTHNIKPNTEKSKTTMQKKLSIERKIGKYNRQNRKTEQKNMQSNYTLKTMISIQFTQT